MAISCPGTPAGKTGAYSYSIGSQLPGTRPSCPTSFTFKRRWQLYWVARRGCLRTGLRLLPQIRERDRPCFCFSCWIQLVPWRKKARATKVELCITGTAASPASCRAQPPLSLGPASQVDQSGLPRLAASDHVMRRFHKRCQSGSATLIGLQEEKSGFEHSRKAMDEN